jgi:hypothetical protein
MDDTSRSPEWAPGDFVTYRSPESSVHRAKVVKVNKQTVRILVMKFGFIVELTVPKRHLSPV